MARGKKSKNSKKSKPKQSLTQKVNDIINKDAELKWRDTTETPIGVVNGGPLVQILTDIPLPAAGAQPTEITRIGNSVKITSIDIRGYVYFTPDTTNDPSVLIRLTCFQYKPNNGLLPPNVARLFNNDDQGNPGPTSHQQIDYQADYHILYDKTFPLIGWSGSAVGGVSNQVKFFHINVPLKRAKKKLEYDAATTGHSNAIYFVVFSNSSNGVGINDPNVAYQSRVRFLDM